MDRSYKFVDSDRYELSDVFDFDHEALVLNRRGQLSADQEARLRSIDRGTARWGLIAGFMLLLSIGALGAIVITQSDGQSAPVIAVAAVGGVALALFLGAILRGRWAKRDFRARKITTLEGPVKRKVKRANDRVIERHFLRIGGSKLLLSSREQLEAFNDDNHFVVHVIRYPGAPIVLSAAKVR